MRTWDLLVAGSALALFATVAPRTPTSSSGAASAAQTASEGVRLTRSEQIGGAVTAVALDGTTAYIGMGQRLVVLDVSDPAHPVALGRTDLLSGVIRQLVADDGVVYAGGAIGTTAPTSSIDAAAGTGPSGPPGIRVIDVTDPASPTPRGFWSAPAQVRSIALLGRTVYVAAGTAGLRVLDASDPDHPTEMAVLDRPETIDDTIAVVADPTRPIIYALEGSTDHLVVIGHDRATPRVVARLPLDRTALSVAVAAGGHVLVGTDRTGGGNDDDTVLLVVDVASPQSPRIVGRVSSQGEQKTLAVTSLGTRAYGVDAAFRCSPRAMFAVDLTDPTAPKLVREDLPSVPDFRGFVAGDGLVLVADGEFGLRVLAQGTVPAGLDTLAHVGIAGYVPAAALRPGTDLAYAATYATRGLEVIDLTDGTALAPVGRADGLPVGWATLVDVVPGPSDLAYVAYGQNCMWSDAGLFVLDVGTPDSPRLLGEVNLGVCDAEGGCRPGHSAAVAVAGDTAYVADEQGWLSIVDVSVPVSPTRVGLLDFERVDAYAEVTDVAVAEGVAYLSVWVVSNGEESNHVVVVDVADPSAPREIARFPTPGWVSSIAVVGDYVYLADLGYGVHVWDVTDPSSPRYVGGNTALNAVDVAVADGRAYAIGFDPALDPTDALYDHPADRVLWVLDATDPATLPELARLPLLDASRVTVDGDRLIVAGGEGGIYVVDVAPSGAAVPTPSPGATRLPPATATRSGAPGASPTPRPTPTPILPPTEEVTPQWSAIFLPKVDRH